MSLRPSDEAGTGEIAAGLRAYYDATAASRDTMLKEEDRGGGLWTTVVCG